MLVGRACSILGAAAICLLNGELPASAATGPEIFETKCAACHANGGNVLNPMKTLDAKVLAANKYDEQAAIVELVRNGKGQMPKYQGAIPKISRLSDEEIEAVSTFVIDKSRDGW